MKNNILTDIGENYEYLRTIVEKKASFAKLDASEKLSQSIGIIALSIILGTVISMILIAISIMIVISLYQANTSLLTSISILIIGYVVIILLLYLLRKPLVYAPINHIIYHIIFAEEDE